MSEVKPPAPPPPPPPQPSQKPEKKGGSSSLKWGCIGCGGLLILLFFLGMIGSLLSPEETTKEPTKPVKETTKKEVTQKEEVKTEEKKEVEKPKTALSDYTEAELKKHLQDKISEEITKVKIDSSGFVMVTYKEDLLWDENDAVFKACDFANDVFEELFKLKGVKKAGAEMQTKFTDKYGNESWERAVYIVLKKEEADKVNWEKFKEIDRGINILEIAETVVIHPGVRKNITNKDILRILALRELSQ
jgi:hypothetical protein